MKIRISPSLILPFFIILGFIVYSPSLSAPFFFDDYEFVTANPLTQNASVLLSQWPEAGFKLVTYITFVFNFIVGGPHPVGYHLVNIIIHIYNAWLVSVLAVKLLQTPQIMKSFDQQQKTVIPFLSGLLFLVHPVATSAVSYIWQRAELLNAAFYISALIYYVMARQEKRIRYYAAAGICFLVGLFAKGTMVSLPLLLVVFELALWPVSRRKSYRLVISVGAFALIAYLMLWEPWRARTLGHTIPFINLTGTSLTIEYVWTQLFVTLKYFGLAVFPVQQNFDYRIALATSFWEPRVYLSAIILTGLIVLAVVLWNTRRLLSIGILWFLICLLPAALLAGREPIWEYRMYMPLSGLLLGIVAGLMQSFDTRKVSRGLILIAGIFSVLTFSRNLLWQSPEHLLLDTIRKSPQSANSYQLLGAFYLQEGRIEDAETYLEKTISLAPDAAESYNNLGLIAKNRRDTQKARTMFEAAIAYRPTLTSAYINLAYLLISEGEENKAEALLRQSLGVRETEGAYAALARVYLLRGELDQAENYLKQALAINPYAAQAYFWYGEVMMARQDHVKAREMFDSAVRINPRLSSQIPQDMR